MFGLERILIWGLGSAGSRHVAIVQRVMPKAGILVYSRRAGELLASDSEEFTASLERVSEFQPQIAIVANEAPLHLKTADILAEMGCHILIEKPVDIDLERCYRFFERHRQRQLVIQVGYNLRFIESVRVFRESIKAGKIGIVTSAFFQVGQFLPNWRNQGDSLESVTGTRALGGGVLLELSHEIDSVEWILGQIEWVQAWEGKTSDLVVDVEDLACLVLGVRCATSDREIVVSLTMDVTSHRATRNYTVVGTAGTVYCDLMRQEVTLFSQHEQSDLENFPEFDKNDAYRLQLCNFVDRIEHGEYSWDSFHTSVRVLQVIDAARKSAKASGVRMMVRV